MSITKRFTCLSHFSNIQTCYSYEKKNEEKKRKASWCFWHILCTNGLCFTPRLYETMSMWEKKNQARKLERIELAYAFVTKQFFLGKVWIKQNECDKMLTSHTIYSLPPPYHFIQKSLFSSLLFYFFFRILSLQLVYVLCLIPFTYFLVLYSNEITRKVGIKRAKIHT